MVTIIIHFVVVLQDNTLFSITHFTLHPIHFHHSSIHSNDCFPMKCIRMLVSEYPYFTIHTLVHFPMSSFFTYSNITMQPKECSIFVTCTPILMISYSQLPISDNSWLWYIDTMTSSIPLLFIIMLPLVGN